MSRRKKVSLLYSGANPHNSERGRGTLASYIGIIYFTDNSRKKRCSWPPRTNPIKSTCSNCVAFHYQRLRLSFQGNEGFFDRLKIGALTCKCSVHTKQQEQQQQIILPKARCQNYLIYKSLWRRYNMATYKDDMYSVYMQTPTHRDSCTHTSRHPRRPRSSQWGGEKRWDESFQVRAKEPPGTDSHRTISKNSSGCRLLIGHKKCFVLLCPIGEQFLLSSFREFVHDGYCLATLARFVHQACACKGNFYFLLS